MCEAQLTLTLIPAAPAPREFHVVLYLDGEPWEEGGWPRVPAVGECFTNRALNYDAHTPELTFFAVEAVIADATAWDATWHVFLAAVTFDPARQTQYAQAVAAHGEVVA